MPIRPQRRTPTLPTLPIGACNNLNVGRRTNLITSDVGRISDQSRDCLAIRNGGRKTLPILPQRRNFTSSNGSTVPYLAGFLKFFCGVGDRMDLQTLRGVGDRTDLESDVRSLRHPQRSEGKIVAPPATTEVNSMNPSATVGWESSALHPQRQTGDHSHLRFPILRQILTLSTALAIRGISHRMKDCFAARNGGW